MPMTPDEALERLREGNNAAIALIAEGQDGTVAGSVRLWPVVAGSSCFMAGATQFRGGCRTRNG